MKEMQPVGPYRLVGYSYGACIAFEMACILQEKEGPKVIESLVLLDGSVHYMQMYRKMYRRTYNVVTENLANNPLFETEIMCSFTLRFANIDYRKMRMELLSQPGWKARVACVVQHVMATGMFKSAETLIWACDALRAKFLCADKYVDGLNCNKCNDICELQIHATTQVQWQLHVDTR
jgi:fatty acid synthase